MVFRARQGKIGQLLERVKAAPWHNETQAPILTDPSGPMNTLSRTVWAAAAQYPYRAFRSAELALPALRRGSDSWSRRARPAAALSATCTEYADRSSIWVATARTSRSSSITMITPRPDRAVLASRWGRGRPARIALATVLSREALLIPVASIDGAAGKVSGRIARYDVESQRHVTRSCKHLGAQRRVHFKGRQGAPGRRSRCGRPAGRRGWPLRLSRHGGG